MDLYAPVWAAALAIPLLLLIAWAFTAVARRLLGSRVRLGGSTAVVVTILSASVGLFIAGLINPYTSLVGPLALSMSAGFALLGLAGYSALAARWQRPVRGTVAEQLTAGESDRVEFKSTARINLHTGQKDARMEQVIAKTVCGFLNSEGGTLLIGVDDGGTPLGLDADLATMKSPDVDRYQLWLRDLFTTGVGRTAASLVEVEFSRVPEPDGPMVCRVSCPAAPRPTYLRAAKGGEPEFWVRIGNSTRQLDVADATEYVMHRWPLSLGANFAAQVKAAVRFSDQRE